MMKYTNSVNNDSNCETKQTDQELEKQYKRCLENWREVLVHVNSLLQWNKPYYPGIIALYITLIFGTLWYFDPSLLTTVSILGIITCILDFAVPTLSSCLFDANKWTGLQEREFEEVCHKLIVFKQKVRETYAHISQFKSTRPVMYFIAVVSGLVFIAWIGNEINNLFLMYFIVLGASLIPGLIHHGYINEHYTKIMQMINSITSEKAKQT